MKKVLLGILAAVVFVGCIALVIVGQKTVGYTGAAVMGGGLAGLLLLMWVYNRRYQ